MKIKQYATEKIAEVAKLLADAPAQPPRFLDHDHTLEELSKHIVELYFKKNYDERQITKILKENGIRTTLKEVKNLIQNKKNSLPKKA